MTSDQLNQTIINVTALLTTVITIVNIFRHNATATRLDNTVNSIEKTKDQVLDIAKALPPTSGQGNVTIGSIAPPTEESGETSE